MKPNVCEGMPLERTNENVIKPCLHDHVLYQVMDELSMTVIIELYY